MIEFRHKSWYDEETVSLLRRYRIGFCIHDMAKLETPVVATSPVVYLRLHGSGARYGGNYSDHKLKAWARNLGALAADADEVWVYFNNDIGGHAPHNAVSLREMLTS